MARARSIWPAPARVWQKRTRDLFRAADDNAISPPTQVWKNTLADRDNAVGINGKQRGLLSGKLELSEDFEYNLGTAKYVPYLVQNITPSLGNAGEVPNISSELKQSASTVRTRSTTNRRFSPATSTSAWSRTTTCTTRASMGSRRVA